MPLPRVTVRDDDLFGPLIGRKVIEITQHDEEEWNSGSPAYVCLHFDNGMTLRLIIEDEPRVFLSNPADIGDA
jgi:hypothetical protein